MISITPANVARPPVLKSVDYGMKESTGKRFCYALMPARGEYSLSVHVIYIASLATINSAELVLSSSITDDDGTLHSITFQHTCFLSQIMVAVTV